jgi:hypothetical protein
VSSWFGIQLVSKARIGFAKKRKKWAVTGYQKLKAQPKLGQYFCRMKPFPAE